MNLHSLTYTSRAAAKLSPRDVDAIHQSALTYNPLDGITGILLYNGEGFMQMIEGAESAIDDLMARLMKDKRHHSIEIRDTRVISGRFFPHWAMHRLDIPETHEAGMGIVQAEISSHLDPPLMDVVDQSVVTISKSQSSD